MNKTVGTFYKVIVLSIDVFESQIVDERHFGDATAANTFAASLSGNHVGVVVKM